jgi:hypothetical protein
MGLSGIWGPTFCGDAYFDRVSSAPASATSVVLPPVVVSASPKAPLNYYVCGTQNATAVLFPTWMDANQDDIVWYAGNKVYNNPNCPPNTWGWVATMSFADHRPNNPLYGPVHVSVYGYDSPYSPTLLGEEIFQWKPSSFVFKRAQEGPTK